LEVVSARNVRKTPNELFRLRHGGSGVGLRKDDQELVASPPEDVVRVANAGRQVVRHELQDVVADGVAFDVVDLLETIDVDEQDRDRRPESA
jgi:hypothetical protein